MTYATDTDQAVGETRLRAEFDENYLSVPADEVGFMRESLADLLDEVDNLHEVTGFEVLRDGLGHFEEIWLTRARRPALRTTEYERVY